jgi:hypothetical protein
MIPGCAKFLSADNPLAIREDGRVGLAYISDYRGIAPYRIAAMPDLNGDGHLDPVWQDPATGITLVWFGGGTQALL